MKTLIIFFTLSFHFMFADDKKFIEVMTQQINALYNSKTPEEYQQSINALERIGNAEKTKWEPFYYSAFGYLMIANREKDAAKKDQFLDLSVAALTKAKELNENESEIVALDGFIQMIRVTIDPPSRGPKFSAQAMQLFGKAIAMNPENPRALALMAQMQFGTAKFFNAPPTEACATNNKAIEKFLSYQASNPLAPIWGKGMAEGLLVNCK
jgi:hypothetical protein